MHELANQTVSLTADQFGTYWQNFGIRFSSDWSRVGVASFFLVVLGIVIPKTWSTWYGKLFAFFTMLGSFWLGWCLYNNFPARNNDYAFAGSNVMVNSPGDLIKFSSQGITTSGIPFITFILVIGIHLHHERRQEGFSFRGIILAAMTGIGSVVLMNIIYGMQHA